jgi:hypothetical protein
MKERLIIIGVFIILIINMISASYVCSDGGSLKEDNKNIGLGKTRIINGILLGLANAEESLALHRIGVDLIIDAQLVNLNNESSSSTINFTDGKSQTITLITSTENEANIKIGESSKLIEEGDIDTINDMKIILISSQGFYPGEADVNVMLGKDVISLSNYGNISKIIKVYEKDYIIELSSVSNDNAAIKVKRCNNASAKLIEIIDNTSLNVSETQNNTNPILNNTNQTNQNNQSLNQSQNYIGNQSNSSGNNQEVSQNKDMTKSEKIIRYISFFAIIIFVIIGLTLGIRYIKNKNRSLESN